METIDIKDLLIGSLIWTTMDEIREVVVIEDNGFIRTCKLNKSQAYNFTNSSAFTPIPLTAEWLEMLGFVKSKMNNGYEYWMEHDGANILEVENYVLVSVHHVFSDSTPTHFARFQDSDERVFSVPVSYIHHLQALIWNLERVWLTLEQP